MACGLARGLTGGAIIGAKLTRSMPLVSPNGFTPFLATLHTSFEQAFKMKQSASKMLSLASVLMLGVAMPVAHFTVARAQDETKPSKSARGGLLVKTAKNQFEVFFYSTGLRLFPLDSAGHLIDASKIAATATFYHPNSPKPWFTRPLQGKAASVGHPPESLDLVIGLSTVPPKGAKVTFEIAGLSDSEDSTAAFTVPVEFVAAPVATSPVPPPAVTQAQPNYVYGPGYTGFGYYQYPGPQAVPAATSAPRVYNYPTSGRQSSGGGPHSTRDWSTGRSYQSGGLISKPWLRPMD